MSASPSLSRKTMKKNSSSQNIKVFVRCRPMNAAESKTLCVAECRNSREVVLRDRPLDKFTKTFTFDRVFGQESKQIDVYRTVAKNSVDEVLSGFNCTIFAYGQTGTGKTFTMEGERTSDTTSWDEDPLAGIIPRCVTHLFDELRVQNLEFSMRVSFLELYNEELFDLLSAHDDLSKLRIYEDATRKGSCVIQGLEEVLVRSKSDVYNILEKGSAKRQTAATLMNAHSSRSHTVFTVTVHIKENTVDGDELLKTGKLHLVDLAGSENIGRSGAIDKRAREAGNINMSLLTLGRVITSLVEKAPHIPYRESKLTRLLQDALGGRTKTSVIATISPSSVNLEETLSTLEYAYRAKNIQNKPEVNQKLNKKELIGEYSNEIERLRLDLMAMREKNGVYLAPENYQEMQTTMELQKQEISNKITHIRAVEEEMEKKIEMFNKMTQQLKNTTQELEQTHGKLENTVGILTCTQKLLEDTVQERNEQKCLVKAHVKTEQKLKEEGHSLINLASTTTFDLSQLHNKLDRKKMVERKNTELTEQFQELHLRQVDEIRGGMAATYNTKEKAFISVMAQMGRNVKKHKAEMCDINEQVTTVRCDCISLVNTIMTSYKSADERQTKDMQAVRGMVSEGEGRQDSALGSFVQDEANPSLEVLATLTSSLATKITSLQTKITATLNTIEADGSAYEGAQSSRLSELVDTANSCNDLDKQYVTISVDAFQSLLTASQANKQNVSSSLHQMVEQIMTLIQSNDRSYDKLSEAVTGTLSSLDQLDIEKRQGRGKCSQVMEEVQQGLVGYTSTLRSHRDQAVGHLKDTGNELEDDMRGLGEGRCELESAVGQYANTARQVTAYTTAAVIRHTQEMEAVCGRQLKETTAMAQSKQEKISSTLKTRQMALEDKSQKLEEEHVRLAGEFESVMASLKEWSTGHDYQLQALATQVQHLITHDMAKDVPTGHTPVRQEYPFSHLLSSTSPHERILGRHRSGTVSTLSKISLPCFRDAEQDEGGFSSTSDSPADLLSSSSSSETSQLDVDSAVEMRSRAGSVSSSKDGSGMFVVPNPPLQREDSGVTTLSRCSSTSSLTDTRENKENFRGSRHGSSTKRRELKQPSVYKAKSTEKLAANPESQTRSRRILGSQN